MKPTLVILAAGMGSRYGGLKQIDPIGPAGETILDYSVYDAIRAGYGKVVFIIRKDIEQDFKEVFANKLQKHIEIDWVFQELDKLPQSYTVPANRTKPWGTGHALMMVADKVNEPFAVINADDFYGAEAFKTLADFFAEQQSQSREDYAMVAYELSNTLSDFGTVSRGICVTDDSGLLKSVTERTKIERKGKGIENQQADGSVLHLEDDAPVSMNFWGFTPSLFKHIDDEFIKFLKSDADHTVSEFYIPSIVDNLIKCGHEKVKVLRNPGQWFGITYKEDKPIVIEKIRQLIAQGRYPENLWK
ncbi:MAG: nucleotidyltransferase [Bacteroidetes bacterium HGW-Bacteroidetes-11]|jgi:choline kinase|nr:MAG: nucleotidyltransferase [Bacteroidetes bacterium HGW-Bacteroidetes-11]